MEAGMNRGPREPAGAWEKIGGFESPGEYEQFVRYIEAQLAAGIAEEVPVDPDHGPGELYGGRWFRSVDTGEVWRLVPPDPPFRGLWELLGG